MRVVLTSGLALLGAWAVPASAHGVAVVGLWVAAAPQKIAAELKATQQRVDAALKTRRARFEAWRQAQQARDEAAGKVADLKRKAADAATLDAALKRALAKDEDAARARSQLLAAESEVARGGAELLSLYDALLVERRRAVEGLRIDDPARKAAVVGYRDLADQRDAVRRALLPVLDAEVRTAHTDVDLEIRADDDVESLLEKADMARDLEERLLRQIDAVKKRIAELSDEDAVARDVSGMVGSSQLFDEEDRRLLVVKNTPTPPQAIGSSTTRGSVRVDDRPPVLGVEGPQPETLDTSPDVVADRPAMTVLSAPVNVEVRAGFVGPQTDAAVAGVLSSGKLTKAELEDLQKRLETEAARLRTRAKALKTAAAGR